MAALFGLFAIIIIAIIVLRIGATALELTGLSPDIAAFQAQSAFCGVGFTTSESESVVSHPVRRRIIRILMLLGSAGITSSMVTLILTFIGQSGAIIAIRVCMLLVGLTVILFIASSNYVQQMMKKIITRALEKWTTLNVYDYQQLLGLSEGYNISRITVMAGSWVCDRTLEDLKADLKDVLVLAIYRKVDGEEKIIGVPKGNTVIRRWDVLLCYAREDASKCLAQRCKAHKAEHKE